MMHILSTILLIWVAGGVINVVGTWIRFPERYLEHLRKRPVTILGRHTKGGWVEPKRYDEPVRLWQNWVEFFFTQFFDFVAWPWMLLIGFALKLHGWLEWFLSKTTP